jgi:hypothetical protein
MEGRFDAPLDLIVNIILSGTRCRRDAAYNVKMLENRDIKFVRMSGHGPRCRHPCGPAAHDGHALLLLFIRLVGE